MIQCEFKNTIFSEGSRRQQFMPGASLAEIIGAIDGKPVEFETHGVVILKTDDDDLGYLVLREHWRLVRPKVGTKVFATVVPHGGGGGGGQGGQGKNAFQVIGTIALIALTAWVGGSGIVTALLAPTLGATAAGVVSSAAQLAIGLGGSVALGLLSKPKAGDASPTQSGVDSANPAAPGVAGITQNPISVYTQVPGIRARAIRVSPPLLARPYTTVEGDDQYVHIICGTCGACSVTELKINETAIADLPSGVIETEVLEGWDDDPELTLVNRCGFEENINLPMSLHHTETDGATLVAPYAGSYPKAHVFRSARDADEFRITLNFGGGLFNYNTTADMAVALRVRIRKVGDVSWINLPEMHVNSAQRSQFRQEIWLHWSDLSDEPEAQVIALSARRMKRFYYLNSEWTANSYFDDGVTGTARSTNKHIHPDMDGVTFYLDTDTFPKGQYDVEITRGFVDVASNFTDTSYTAGLFTYRTLTGSVQSIPGQNERGHQCAIESYTTFRDVYPIAERGLALIAVKAKNLQINSVSALFGSYVNVWNGADWDDVEVSGNPAALWRDVWSGSNNARAVSTSRFEDSVAEWFEHCEDEGLECNHVVTQGSVEQISALIGACGDAVTRDSDKLGVVIDRDRSDEPVACMFHPGNMTSPLVVTKQFVTGARGLVPNIRDADRDYASRDLDPVFDDGLASSASTLTEQVTYDGYTDVALAIRRARLDLRRQRCRTLKYSWGCHLSHLKAKKGSIVGLSHDILLDAYGQGRVSSWTTSGGNLESITLNTNVSDLPAIGYDNLFDVENVLTLANLFTLAGPKVGLQIELSDSTVVTIPISGVEDRTLFVEGTVAVPDGLQGAGNERGGCLAAVGLRDKETRRVILTGITPKPDLFAQLEAVDAAPEIFEGL